MPSSTDPARPLAVGAETPERGGDEALESALRERLRRARRERTCPGAALAVLERGRPRLELLEGRWTYAEDSPPVELDSLFDLASLTKVLATTALAARCHEEGRPALDEAGPDSEPAPRRLLAHAAGFPACIPPIPDHDRGPEDPAVRQAARAAMRAARDHPGAPAAEPATLYSDLGFIALGERLAGPGALAEAVEREILGPAGLSGGAEPGVGVAVAGRGQPLAKALPSERRPGGVARRGLVHDELAAALGGFAGHAGLFGNLRGVVRLVQLWIPGVGAELWSPRTTAEFIRPARLDPASSRALGWETGLTGRAAGGPGWPAGDWFGHTGYTGGCVWITPLGDGFVLLTNRTWPQRPAPEVGSREIHRLRADIGRMLAEGPLRGLLP